MSDPAAADWRRAQAIRTSPCGSARVLGLPVGVSQIGPAWSEARLLGYGWRDYLVFFRKLKPCPDAELLRMNEKEAE